MSCPLCQDSGFVPVADYTQHFNPDEAFCDQCPFGVEAKAFGLKSPWPGQPVPPRNRYTEVESLPWFGPRDLGEFETGLDQGRAFTRAGRAKQLRWMRLARAKPTKVFRDGAFLVKVRVIGTSLTGFFLPSDLATPDNPTFKLAPSAYDPWEPDSAARATFGMVKRVPMGGLR